MLVLQVWLYFKVHKIFWHKQHNLLPQHFTMPIKYSSLTLPHFFTFIKYFSITPPPPTFFQVHTIIFWQNPPIPNIIFLFHTITFRHDPPPPTFFQVHKVVSWQNRTPPPNIFQVHKIFRHNPHPNIFSRPYIYIST